MYILLQCCNKKIESIILPMIIDYSLINGFTYILKISSTRVKYKKSKMCFSKKIEFDLKNPKNIIAISVFF